MLNIINLILTHTFDKTVKTFIASGSLLQTFQAELEHPSFMLPDYSVSVVPYFTLQRYIYRFLSLTRMTLEGQCHIGLCFGHSSPQYRMSQTQQSHRVSESRNEGGCCWLFFFSLHYMALVLHRLSALL